MRSAVVLFAISLVPAVLLSAVTASHASAATGRLEIITGSSVEVITDPLGCISLPPNSGRAQVTVINQTSSDVSLYTTSGCAGFGLPLAAGQTATGAYGSVLAP